MVRAYLLHNGRFPLHSIPMGHSTAAQARVGGQQSRAYAPMQKLKPVPKVAVEMRTPTALERYLPVGCAPSVPEYGSVLSTASSCRMD